MRPRPGCNGAMPSRFRLVPSRLISLCTCALLLALLGSCGVRFNFANSPSGVASSDAKAGTALDAFKRELGLRVDGDSAESEGRGGLSAELRDRYSVESDQADQLLSVLRKQFGGLRLRDLPAGASRAERLAYARGLIELGRPLEAEPALNSLLRDEPRFFPALFALGRSALATEQWERAREYIGDYLSYQAEDGLARAAWARASLRLEEHREEAIAALNEQLDSKEDAPQAAYILADWYFTKKEYGKAIAPLERAMEQGDRSIRSRWTLGLALLLSGRFEDSREYLEEVARLPSPLQSDAIAQLIQVERELGDFAQAYDYYERLRDGNFEDYRQQFGLERFEELGRRLRQEKESGRRLSKRIIDLRRELREPGEGVEERARREAFESLLGGLRDKRLEPEELLGDLKTMIANEEDTQVMRLFALVQHLRLTPADRGPIELGLRAKDPVIRLRAATLLKQLGRRTAKNPKDLSMSFRALERETDAKTFRALHDTLVSLSGHPLFLGFAAESDADERRDCVESWARQLGLELSEGTDPAQGGSKDAKQDGSEGGKKARPAK
jgi:hypothetical protein